MQKKIRLGAVLMAVMVAGSLFSGFAPVNKIGVPDTASKKTATPKPKKTAKPTKTPKVTPAVGLGKVGEIKIPDTRVDYPVVVAVNNEYYMNRDNNGKKDVNGSIFLDFRNRDATRRKNLIVYGHNMKSGKMFADLHKWEDAAYFNNNKYMELTLFGKKYEYEIFAVGQYNVTKHNYVRTQFETGDNGADFVDFVNSVIIANATHSTPGATFTKDDEILTLSTCVKSVKTDRWVAFARRVKELPLPSPTIPVTAKPKS